MNKKSFFLGALAGSVFTFVVLLVISSIFQKSGDNDPIQYLEKSVSYENKAEASFEVFQVLDYGALASEASDEIGGDVLYDGNTVLIQGKDFYSDQIVVVKNPKRVGTYNYTSNGGMPMTVPVIEGDIQ